MNEVSESAKLTVSSPDIAQGSVPRELTCEGANRPPRVSWTGTPGRTREIVVELLDPDAPVRTFTHWLVYGIPPETTGLGAVLPRGALEGRNDFGQQGYGGPCPPPGPAHRYHLVVFAVDRKLGLGDGARRPELESRMQGHILARGELVATYRRD